MRFDDEPRELTPARRHIEIVDLVRLEPQTLGFPAQGRYRLVLQ